MATKCTLCQTTREQLHVPLNTTNPPTFPIEERCNNGQRHARCTNRKTHGQMFSTGFQVPRASSFPSFHSFPVRWPSHNAEMHWRSGETVGKIQRIVGEKKCKLLTINVEVATQNGQPKKHRGSKKLPEQIRKSSLNLVSSSANTECRIAWHWVYFGEKG